MHTIAPTHPLVESSAPAGRDPGPVGGVDTHADTHTAAVIDASGRLLGHHAFPTTAAGYDQLTSWMAAFGPVARVGVEGTGAYGAGLTRHLRANTTIEVVEVDRNDRKARRFAGKADPLDAESAARAVLSGVRTGIPKQTTSDVEALRVLRIARHSGVDDRADATRQIKSLLITAPEELRAGLRGLSTTVLVRTCAHLRPAPVTPTSGGASARGLVLAATKTALRSLARRHQRLTAEITDLEKIITVLVSAINPALLALPGVGPDSAGQLLVTAGANAERVHSEPALAMLTGVAPIPASSGKTRRHRLNRGGDRQANAALHRIILSRLRCHEATQTYMTRRIGEGLSRAEIIRCLKRHLIREIYRVLHNPTPHTTETALAA